MRFVKQIPRGHATSRLEVNYHKVVSITTVTLSSSPSRQFSSTSPKYKLSNNDNSNNNTTSTTSFASNQSWSEEWKKLGLGAKLPKSPSSQITNLLFVQTGFGVDQHGDRKSDGATKAAVRAVRNAIEFNAIPGVIEAVPGGRKEMLIQVLLGVPPKDDDNNFVIGEDDRECKGMIPMDIDLADVAKVFPYGRLLPIQVVVGGLKFPTGRIVTELGDKDDNAICVVASISIGYDNEKRDDEQFGKNGASHTVYNTNDGF